uniref:Putative glycosyltransferase n=1 Tax=viral metagenome TaxID=1070528 RepID=A0A6M3LPV8_9ZZZZ
MNEIRVEDVITKAIELLDKPRKQSVIEVTFGRLEKVVDQPLRDCRARVAYLVACYNRVHLLERFLASFSQSIPQEGDVFFLNDASDDPRVEEMLQGFNVEGLKKHVLHVDRGEKVVFLSSYKKMPSARAYNQLFKAALEVHEQTPFDFLTILDPDALMRPMWSQKLILTYRDAVKYHPEIGLFSAFNNENHPIYECKDSNVVFAGPVGKYRLRNGVNLQFMLTPEFFKGHHGFYEYEHSYSTKSSDLPKNEMLAAKGFKSMILVPSMLQHMGAYDSALPRRRSNELAGDFI